MNNKSLKTAAIIIIGNEILSGRTQDKNIAYLGKELEQLGIVLAEVIIIPDIEQTIIDKVKHYSENYDYVFTTGGIGPTHDDITTESIAKAFNVKALRNPEAVAIMDEYYEAGTLTEARLKMADIPEGASLIDNPVSAAPAYQIDNVFVLAGVPSIMQGMFQSLVDRLVGGPPILTVSICTNLTESKLVEGMTNIQNECESVSIGSYPYFKGGKLGVNIILRSTQSDVLYVQSEKMLKLVEEIGGTVLEHNIPT